MTKQREYILSPAQIEALGGREVIERIQQATRPSVGEGI